MDLQEADMPHEKSGYSLLKVRAIGICGTDIHAFAGNQPFFQYPRILGHELGPELMRRGVARLFPKSLRGQL
ncbi:MAG: alcohol dehydrogenase catalytic domain-containing protein, partial [Aquirufa sp.]